MKPNAPTILFGAFDRHNFGDLLFPHIVAALLPRHELLFAGLAERDLRLQGGHRVRSLVALAAALRDHPVRLIHVGGELLTCDAWQAAVMLSPPEAVQQIIARLDAKPAERQSWAHAQLGLPDLAPYAVSSRLFPQPATILYNAVGGVELGRREPQLRAEVLAKLERADWVGVRDRLTLDELQTAGIPARLIPDPAVMVAQLFGSRIRRQGECGEPAAIRQAFPQGYLAVQFSADFGDDASLAEIASQLDYASTASGHAVVLFRAGAAPWHDDLACYRRLESRMRAPVWIFQSLNLWDICALIAYSKAYCGSSLHGRIVAAAFAVPHLSFLHPDEAARVTKQAAYAGTWGSPCQPATTGINRLAAGIAGVLSTEPARLQAAATEMTMRYQEQFEAVRATLLG